MSDLVINQLVKRYNDNDPPVVKGISIEVEKGELVSLLGPSGCGKTTILRMIAGLLLPNEGSISIKDKDVTKLPAYKRDIGMVFQSYALFPHLTVAENIAFGLKMRKEILNRTELKEQINQALDMVNLSGYGDRYPKNLSGGQQQRVALARALILKPAVLLLDEPLSALDAKLRYETREEIRRLQQNLGVATVFVTHDQEEALAMSDKIAVLSHGVIQQYERPNTLFEQPSNEFVAAFMGVSNLFKIKTRNADAFITEDNLVIKGYSEDPSITSIGIRPERLKVKPVTEDVQAENQFRGRVVKLSYNGAMMKFYIKLPSGQELASLIQSNLPEAQIQEQEEVIVYWDSKDTLYLLPEIQH